MYTQMIKAYTYVGMSISIQIDVFIRNIKRN